MASRNVQRGATESIQKDESYFLEIAQKLKHFVGILQPRVRR